MKSQQALNILLGIYIFIFFTYLFGPLVIMSITAFNSAEFPSVTPWECFSLRWFNEGKIAYDGQHLAGLATDWRLHEGLITSLKIGLGVVLLAVPIGLAASLVLTQVHSRFRTAFYSISIMPVLFPGVIIGISTVVLWDRIATMGGGGLATQLGRNGIFLTILAQTCFISTYCFLIFVARLQRFDQTQEEAALDLGANQTQVFFKILIPYMMPAIASSCVIAFLASFENYNTTVFSILSDQTLTTVIASKVRLGISPAISSLALVIILITLTVTIIYEVLRRREDKKKKELEAEALFAQTLDSRLRKAKKNGLKIPKSIFGILFVIVVCIFGFNKMVEKGLYGSSCIAATEKEKKSNFADQLKLLQKNAEIANQRSSENGDVGEKKEYNSIFGDPNLFKDFGGFDSKDQDQD
jgi:ABC-type spermidine/putrescine transport system permease subunit II